MSRTTWLLPVVIAVVGCADPPATRKKDRLELGDDEAASKKASKDTSEEGPKNENGTIELGSGTRGQEASGNEGQSSGSNTAPAGCTADAQCNQTGRICTDGACVKGCRTNAGCGTNQTCDEGQCIAIDTSVECTSDYDCALGTICLSSQCVPGCYDANDCPTGQACSAGQCRVQTGTTTGSSSGGGGTTTSTPCTSDGACNPGNNGSGQICSAQGVCVDGCHQDYQCPGVRICTSGQCR